MERTSLGAGHKAVADTDCAWRYTQKQFSKTMRMKYLNELNIIL